VPASGPLITIPLNYAAELWPSLSPVAGAVAGPAGVNQSPLQQLLPTVITRVLGVLPGATTANNGVGGLGANTAKINATVEAMQYLLAAGKGPPTNATVTQVQAWSLLVSQWATHFLLWRAVLGFVVPGSPEVNIDPLKLSSRLTQLMNSGLPYNQALAVFLKENPHGIPYTVAHTKSPTGAYIGETAGTMSWLEANKAALKAHPYATAWLLPGRLASGVFSDTAYNYELTVGIRERLGVTAWADQAEYKLLANQYYTAEDTAFAAENVPGADYNVIRTNFAAWKQKFLAAYPVFANQLTSSNGPQTRNLVIQDMKAVFADPNVPKTPTILQLQELLKVWDEWKSYMDVAGLTNTATIRWTNTQEMLAWGASYAAAHPDILGFWNGVLKFQTVTSEGKA
jgi:hypothetical protein